MTWLEQLGMLGGGPTSGLLVRRSNGKLFRQNGLLIRATAASLAAYRKCCCGLPPNECTCDDLCAAPSFRITFQAVGCDPGDLGRCATTATYTGTFTEGNPLLIPTPLPCGGGTIGRYFTAQPTMPCAIPNDPLIELSCCPVGGRVLMELRINNQTWRSLSNVAGENCVQYWALNSIAATEFATDPSCCGTANLQIWCGMADIGAPDCDLANT